jgi:hypothetical protein
LHRQLGRFLTLKDPVDVTGRPPERSDLVR